MSCLSRAEKAALVTLRTGRWLRCVAPAVEVDLSCVVFLSTISL
ncbi:hypothetical protein T03_8723 [Trichinella britovi]|uniref:Uncharacterized protein n=1 Tax=Trichinella britovi TaxID=45882 RepID=A0A0V1BCE8_TRIBR|nr:hypothetical protein T03_8723 [Trichinella britovi]